MIRACLALVALIIFPTAGLSQDTAIGERLRAYFEPLVETRDFSGVIAVRRGDELVAYERFGYADWETGARFTPDSTFAVGSVTKSLTAGLVLQMSQDGQIDLDAPARRYLPDLDPAFTASVADILHHRAGLPRDFPPGALSDTRSQSVIDWLNETQSFGPGPHPEAYSNVGYSVLAIIAERAGHGRFETLATMELLAPLGMTSSRLSRENAQPNVSGYSPGPLPLDLQPPMNLDPGFGATGLVTTIDDLMRLADAVASRRLDLFQPDGSLIGSFSARTLAGETIYTIQGSVPGFSAGASAMPGRELTLAYATNIESYSNWGIRDILHRLVLDQAVEPAPLRQASHELTDAHRALVGRYQTGAFGPAEISETEAGLTLTLLGPGWIFYLTPQTDGAVLWRTFNIMLAPARNQLDEIIALNARQSLLGQPEQNTQWQRDMPPAPEISEAGEP